MIAELAIYTVLKINEQSINKEESIFLKNGHSVVLSKTPNLNLDFGFNDSTLTSFSENKNIESKIQLSPQAIKAIQLLDSWENGDTKEQKETWKYLVKVLDEDRSSDRKLFP